MNNLFVFFILMLYSCYINIFIIKEVKMEIKEKLDKKMEEFVKINGKFIQSMERGNSVTINEKKEIRKNLGICVREIENLRKEYDEAIGFNMAQKKIHDIVFSVDTKKEGYMDIASYNQKLNNFSKLLYTLFPQDRLNLVSITTGSTGLTMDFERNAENNDVNLEGKKEEASSLLKTVVDMTDNTKAVPAVFVKQIQEKYSYDDDKAKKVFSYAIKALSDENSNCEKIKGISVNTVKEDKSFNLDIKSEDKNLSRLPRLITDINKIFKKEDPLIVSGQMRQLEEWEKGERAGHKFIIVSEDDKTYTINYSPVPAVLKKVKEDVGKFVKVKRYKDGKSWWLENWA